MKKTPFVTRLYIFYFLSIMISCNDQKITVLSDCIIPSHPTANSISFANGKILSIGNNYILYSKKGFILKWERFILNLRFG